MRRASASINLTAASSAVPFLWRVRSCWPPARHARALAIEVRHADAVVGGARGRMVERIPVGTARRPQRPLGLEERQRVGLRLLRDRLWVDVREDRADLRLLTLEHLGQIGGAYRSATRSSPGSRTCSWRWYSFSSSLSEMGRPALWCGSGLGIHRAGCCRRSRRARRGSGYPEHLSSTMPWPSPRGRQPWPPRRADHGAVGAERAAIDLRVLDQVADDHEASHMVDVGADYPAVLSDGRFR